MKELLGRLWQGGVTPVILVAIATTVSVGSTTFARISAHQQLAEQLCAPEGRELRDDCQAWQAVIYDELVSYRCYVDYVDNNSSRYSLVVLAQYDDEARALRARPPYDVLGCSDDGEVHRVYLRELPIPKPHPLINEEA